MATLTRDMFNHVCWFINPVSALPISQRAPAKNGPNSLLVNVDIPIDTKRLARISFYPSKIDLVIGDFPHFLWVFP